MKNKIILRLFLCFFLYFGAMMPSLSYASQVYGHLYYAHLLLSEGQGRILSIQDSTREAFYLGSLAPDVVWIAYMVTNPEIRGRLNEKYGIEFPSDIPLLEDQIDDVHQSRPISMAMQVVESAVTQEERAYALGWASHFVVDSFIHDLIDHQGGFVVDPSQFEDPAMKMHDRLEALEMRHVLQLQGPDLLEAADDAQGAKFPIPLLLRALDRAYPDNSYYKNNPDEFTRIIRLSNDLVLDSTRWYAYEYKHSPREISRMKKILLLLRPNQGKLVRFLTDLPSLEEYHEQLTNSPFMHEWKSHADEIEKNSNIIMNYGLAYYWWKDRRNQFSEETAGRIFIQFENELRRINPSDDLMMPHQQRRN